MSKKNTSPEIQWDLGSAYELFISLYILHESDSYGIRPSYAAGVRSRIPAAERKLLEDVLPISGIPLRWIHDLPAPKDAIIALWAMKQIPAAKRMIKLHKLDEPCCYDSPEDQEKHNKFNEVLTRVASQGKWEAEDAAYFLKMMGKKGGRVKKENIERGLDWWSRPAEFGEGFLSALQAYYQSFFEQEEKRVEPILRAGLERAQRLASKMNIDELFFELQRESLKSWLRPCRKR